MNPLYRRQMAPPPPPKVNTVLINNVLDVDFKVAEEIDVDFKLDEDISCYFRNYVSNNPDALPKYYVIEENDTDNLNKILERLSYEVFKEGDFIIARNELRTKYSVYLRIKDDWVAFGGKSSSDNEQGDVDIIIDEDDE